MKQFYLIALAALAVCACTPKQSDPIADAIVAEMMKEIDQPYQITVEHLQKLDSTTYATEFQRRIGIYEIRLDQNTARMEKYIREKSPTPRPRCSRHSSVTRRSSTSSTP